MRRPQKKLPWYKPLKDHVIPKAPGDVVQADDKYIWIENERKYQRTFIDIYTGFQHAVVTDRLDSVSMWDGAVERAHGVIDQEYYLNPTRTWKSLEEYLHFYNYERIHLGKYLNGMIPVEKLNYYLSTVSPLKGN